MAEQGRSFADCLKQAAEAARASVPGDNEVTSEMIEAGLDVLLGYCPDTAMGDAVDRQMVVEIYRAMALSVK